MTGCTAVPDIVGAIGQTPLVRLRGDASAPGALFGKLELLNPFGMKDRAARRIILEARRTGELREGAPIVESSSGTMALGVALVGRALAHPVHIVTDPRIDPITLAKLHALGCAVHVVERMTRQGWQSARLERLSALLSTLPGAFWTRQYENPGNPLGYAELAVELIEQLDRVDVLVGSVGSGGSLGGSARELRRRGVNPRVVGVDAVGSVIFGQADRPARLQSGLGNSLAPRNVDFAAIDDVHWLSDAEAFGATYELARHEQIFGGNSSGSAYLVARWMSSRSTPANNTAPARYLIEEYMTGDEVSVETAAYRDETAVIGITDKTLAGFPSFIEAGHMFPAHLQPELAQATADLVRDTLRAVGFDHGVAHTEVKLTPHGPRIVEVNARLGGNYTPDLVRAVTGVDIPQVMVQLALGERPALAAAAAGVQSAAIRFLLPPEAGQLLALEGVEFLGADPNVVEWEITAQPGLAVRRPVDNSDYLGRVMVLDRAGGHARDLAEAAANRVRLRMAQVAAV